MYVFLLPDFSYQYLIYLNALSRMTKGLEILFFSWFIDFVIRLQDIKYLHYQFGLILHTGTFVHVTEVSLYCVIPYLQPLGYPVTIQTFKEQFEYLHLAIGESAALLYVIPFCFVDQHGNIMNMSVTFVTLFHQGFTNRLSYF